MTYREWTSVVQLLGGALVIAWLAYDILVNGAAGREASAIAADLLWLLLAIIAVNIVGMILLVMLVGMIRRETIRDEGSDERDDEIDARSSRIGYVVASAGAAACLLPIAFGLAPTLAVYALFVAPLLGGLAHAAAQLAFYRTR